MTTVLRFATTTPPIPVTVDTFETRRPEMSPKVTTFLRFATTTTPIPVTVDTFETRRPEMSPKVTTVLRFATTTPPIPVTVDTFVIRNVKSNDSSAFRDDFRLRQVRRKSDTSPTLRERLRTIADDCGRLGTIADACEHKRNDLASPPGPLDRNLKTGTLLLRIRENFRLIFPLRAVPAAWKWCLLFLYGQKHLLVFIWKIAGLRTQENKGPGLLYRHPQPMFALLRNPQ